MTSRDYSMRKKKTPEKTSGVREAAPMKLYEFVETAASGISKIFDREGEVLPMYHIIAGDGRDVVMPGFPGDKDVAVALARAFMESVEATRYIFATEAWILDQEACAKVADVEAASRAGLANHPLRKEILLFAAEDESDGMIMAHRGIIRVGDHARLGPLKIFEQGGSLEGRMIGLLPKQRLVS